MSPSDAWKKMMQSNHMNVAIYQWKTGIIRRPWSSRLEIPLIFSTASPKMLNIFGLRKPWSYWERFSNCRRMRSEYSFGGWTCSPTVQVFLRISFFNLIRSTSVHQKDILQNSDFKKLCRSLERNAPQMELNDVIDALNIISSLGQKTSSSVTERLLKRIEYQINDKTWCKSLHFA